MAESSPPETQTGNILEEDLQMSDQDQDSEVSLSEGENEKRVTRQATSEHKRQGQGKRKHLVAMFQKAISLF